MGGIRGGILRWCRGVRIYASKNISDYATTKEKCMYASKKSYHKNRIKMGVITKYT